MLFDTSGTWIRPEGEGFICGIAPDPENDPDAYDDFEPDYDLFDEKIWMNLAKRVPGLESLRMTAAWAGHYEINTFDHNGIVGPHDEIKNLMFATGFSGHGVMQAPAAGRGIAELICTGDYQTLDLTPLGYDRITKNIPLRENTVY
jgi:glycine/D-amino acid oxidase-like deaminating enzyme